MGSIHSAVDVALCGWAAPGLVARPRERWTLPQKSLQKRGNGKIKKKKERDNQNPQPKPKVPQKKGKREGEKKKERDNQTPQPKPPHVSQLAVEFGVGEIGRGRRVERRELCVVPGGRQSGHSIALHIARPDQPPMRNELKLSKAGGKETRGEERKRNRRDEDHN